MSKETATMFTGVNVGYGGDQMAIKDPDQAVEIVNQKLSDAGKTGYKTFPGAVVYHTGWGCPEGGEAVAAVTTEQDPEAAIETGVMLCETNNQSTLTVSTYIGDERNQTKGFVAEVSGVNLRDIAASWQRHAAPGGETLDPYPSTGMYTKPDGTVIIQAEANPAFTKDMGEWQQNVEAVATAVSSELGIEVKLEFRDAGHVYIQNPASLAKGAKIDGDDITLNVKNNWKQGALTAALEKFGVPTLDAAPDSPEVEGVYKKGEAGEMVTLGVSGEQSKATVARLFKLERNVSTEVADGAAEIRGNEAAIKGDKQR